MGSSKSKLSKSGANTSAKVQVNTQQITSQSNMASGNKKIAIIYYSMYKHVETMAQAVKKGVDSVPGFEGVLLQVAETLSPEILGKMHAPPKSDIPIVNPHDLPEYSGFLFGIPTRFGVMSAQMKAFFDATGQHWTTGALVGKPAGVFISVGTQGGGMETTALTTVTQLTHHGMVFVPPGYSFGAAMFDNSEVHGGSPYGAGTFAGADGSRQPSKYELEYAEHQGKYFTSVAAKLAA